MSSLFCIFYKVYGALLGKVNGRNVEIINSFELVVNELEGHIVLDSDFCTKKDPQYRQVFSDLEFVGAPIIFNRFLSASYQSIDYFQAGIRRENCTPMHVISTCTGRSVHCLKAPFS